MWGRRYDATICPHCRTEASLGELAKRKSERRDTFMGAIAALVIGAGAIVLPNIIIADYAVIGAGAVVIKNVAAGVTVVGNPAKLIKD